MMLLEILAYLWLVIMNILLFFGNLGFLFRKKLKKTEDEPFVSVIIAVWKEGKRLKLTLNSILQQSYPRRKFEIIVSGGGDDETLKICRKFERKGAIKFIFEKERSGKWFALNKAVKIAKYELIAFIDADCVAEKNWLKKLVSEIGDNDLIVSGLSSISSKSIIARVHLIFMPVIEYYEENISRFFKTPMFFGYGSLIKKSVLEKLHFTKGVVEDWKYSLDMLKKNYKIVMSRDAIVYEYFAKTAPSMRMPLVRVLEGFVQTTIPEGDWFAFSLFFMLLTGAIGLPLSIYFLLTGSLIAATIFCITLLQIAILSIAVSILEKNVLYLWTIVIYFPIYLICVIFSIEAFIRILVGKEFGWPVYEKA